MDHTKILFEYDSGVPGQPELESLWVCPVPEGFKIDNIPFHVRGIAVGDIVVAEKDAGGMLRYKELVRSSGHSTIRLWFAKNDEMHIASVRQMLRGLGCASEQSELPRLVAVDVPVSVSYERIRTVLDEHEKLGDFEYEEACLGFL
jgi:hypothetical protein